jgi:hypothetical protein
MGKRDRAARKKRSQKSRLAQQARTAPIAPRIPESSEQIERVERIFKPRTAIVALGGVAIPILIAIALQMFGIDDPLVGHLALMFIGIWVAGVCAYLLLNQRSIARKYAALASVMLAIAIIFAVLGIDRWFSQKRLDRELLQPVGVLMPANDPSPTVSCPSIPADAVAVYLGSHWMSCVKGGAKLDQCGGVKVDQLYR